MTNQTKQNKTIVILRRVALSAAAFACIICILIIVNHFQLRNADPLNSSAMKTLIERMNNKPEDTEIRQEIRELDLLARKAFFTNQWQIKTGGYLLAFCVLIIIICLKAEELITKKLPDPPVSTNDSFWDDRLLSRRWIAISGISLIVLGLVFAYFSYDQLGHQISRVASGSLSSGQVATEPEPEHTTGSLTGSAADTAVSNDSAGTTGIPVFPSQQEINKNFPYFRGPMGSGIAFQENIPTNWDGKSGKNILWKTAIPLPGYNSPVVWNDRVFLSGANDKIREVYCFNLQDGKLLWQTVVEKIPASPASSPRVNGETGYAAPTLATDGRKVYAIFANGDIIALDMNGKPVWSKNLGVPKNHYGHSSSLMLYRDRLIVQYDQSGNASVMALNTQTGEQVWKTSRDVKVSWASPILANSGQQTELILLAEPYMIAYNPVSGKELWRIECISGEVGPSAAYASGIAYSVNDYSKLAAVKTGPDPQIIWENDEFLSDIPSPVATGQFLFLPTTYGTMLCYDAKDGTKYWEKDFGTPTYASPIYIDGRIYQLDKKGIMHIIKPEKTFIQIAQSSLGEGSVCTPAFSDGKILIRGDKNLYCIGK